jgi:spore coat protein A, manganese oxidase
LRSNKVIICTRLAIAAAAIFAAPVARAQTVLDASTLTKYLDPLPNPLDKPIAPTGTLNGAPLYDVSISQFQQRLHSELPPTTLWGYNGVYPGPTFEVERGEMIKVRWTNNLVDGAGQPLPHLLPYDATLHGAGPVGGGGHGGHGGSAFPQSRTVTHLHGGVVDEMSDGYPEHWFSGDPHAAANGLGGPAGNSLVTTYPNEQRAATMWYHDHAMAETRLNVYAGMAGFYILRDAEESAFNLPSGNYEVPLMIQDRSFSDDGQLYYPGADEPGGSHGSHVSFFLGNANLVNGVVWPYMEVEPRKYRLRLLNAANSRAYDLSLVPMDGAAPLNPVVLHQIGVDGGLLPTRVDRESIALSPADRADVIVDFSKFDVGDTLRLMNDGLSASEGTTDQVMEFRVVPSAGPDLSNLPTSLLPIERYRPEDAVRVRPLQLSRSFDSSGRVRWLLDGRRWEDAITEIMQLGELEIWEITNTTGDDHPIHLHLEAFQLLGRRDASGPEIPLEEHERGWEDTLTIPNGQVVRLMVKYETFAGTFVWHCHILEHEDNEMMRPLRIDAPEPAAGAIAAIAAMGLAFGRRRLLRKEAR